ncbi:MAG: bifunctional precorrin-2 dehydrogenase/sirohydrochlorin ferrochelatase [Crenarchaeota archaeon]|nr:MAG: bifunctional precorrin-2 dehydrogenase/sirohydrochlorin ferrochelatase [Thermoproteota archaeon]RDJ33743.1 MAG: bifunctional precorrin-2 dehydrogenase/sirohydrochlorin ferrochelatase [Thermoproteota archaeon]RDJ37146.1 MAG: bifunctional precorrin-2 dehydrogenase/sirohydrochlorin ferrochelatase [Thermoproteota archaeon]RDJ37321.1 MAG: bifunctional precorrin-2 dehydrogenase/sirohydrochlorin ferrochelatase [Thermoproteota archaeon]
MIVDLHLKGNLVIVVGGGAEGLKKINSLLTQDCKILLVSDSINPQIKKYVDSKKIEFQKVKLDEPSFLSKHKPYLVMATTDNKNLNRKIVEAARKLNCLAYASDDPEISDFAHPSVINIEDTIQIAISTKGKSPAMARRVKMQAEKVFKELITREDIELIKIQEIARQNAKKEISTQIERKKYLYAVINDNQIKQLIKDNKLEIAQKRANQMLRDWK